MPSVQHPTEFLFYLRDALEVQEEPLSIEPGLNAQQPPPISTHVASQGFMALRAEMLVLMPSAAEESRMV